jgi:peptidylprolyl isomerase
MQHHILRWLGFLAAAACGCVAQAADDMIWREVAPDNVVFMELQEGRVVIELNPLFAPKAVDQFRRLVQSRFYDGLSFYRVIDGFVAQGGDGSDLGELSEVDELEAEFEIDWHDELPFVLAQQPDLFAPATGFIDGFAAARDADQGKIWLAHCPGIVAMARNDDPGSSRTDFYIVIGQAPRYLDRNLTVFGRVLEGMDVVQRIRRGPADANGVIEDDLGRSRIRAMKLLSEFAKEDRLHVYVMDTSSRPFDRYLDDRRVRRQEFFHHKPPRVLDVCQVPVAARLTR